MDQPPKFEREPWTEDDTPEGDEIANSELKKASG
jgi:hypothetical protein